MPRAVRDSRLGTRGARLKLKPVHEPYWRQIYPRLYIGYRRGIWYLRQWVDGRYRKRTLGTADDYQDADGREVLSFAQACRHAMQEAPRLEGRATPTTYRVADAMRDYLGWYADNRKSLATTKATIKAHILPALGRIPVEQLTSDRLRRWHSGLARVPARLRGGKHREEADDAETVRKRKASANRILTTLRAALNFAFVEGKVSSDTAWRRVRPFRNVDSAKLRYLTVAEARRLVNSCSSDFRKLVRGALETGARYSELSRLRVSDFNADAPAISIAAGKGRHRWVPLTDAGAAFFLEVTAGRSGAETLFLRSNGEPWGRAQQVRRMRDACKLAKIEPSIHFHGLRDTFASTLVQSGVPLQVVQQLLGHADLRMTLRYAHLAPDYISDQLRANLPSFEPHQEDRLRSFAPKET